MGHFVELLKWLNRSGGNAMEAQRQVMKAHLEMVCVSELEREGSTDQRVWLKSPVTSRASLCIFSLDEPFSTERLSDTTMAISIKNKTNKKSSCRWAQYCIVYEGQEFRGKADHSRGQECWFLCSELWIEVPASLCADYAKCCVIKLCVLQPCQVYGFDLHVDEQRMAGVCSPGKQFSCEVIWGTKSSQCLKGHKHP